MICIKSEDEISVEELTEWISKWMQKCEKKGWKISSGMSDRLALSIKHQIDNKRKDKIL